MSNCAYCGHYMTNIFAALEHADKCREFDTHVLFSEDGRGCCEACEKDRGLVYVIYEARFLCLECASIWRKVKQEKQDNE